MQHSSQEIKTRLGEAVDPEGNVLNMAAVVEVIGLLERTPLTKEALEQTRIGRTVNLLRKKTDNEDIAKRAKKLVKKWQKLVQNHLEAVRNTNSPLNGLLCNSPVVNGSATDDKKTEGESAIKPKPTDRLHSKRKRSSSSTPPPGGGIGNDNVSRDKLDANLKENNANLRENSVTQIDSQVSTEDKFVDISGNSESQLTKRLKSSEGSATGHNHDKTTVDDISIADNASRATTLPHNEDKETLDHNDVRWKRHTQDFSQQTEDVIDLGHDENQQDLCTVALDLGDQTNGITGYFGEDGQWYNWAQTMPSNGGNLIVLPYVLLE